MAEDWITDVQAMNADAFPEGNVLITVPHMDDCVLACGGTILGLPDKRRVHLVYCTDGRGILGNPRRAARMVSGEARIGEIRQAETRNALSKLGVLLDHVHFLTFPERRVPAFRRELRAALAALVADLRPALVLAPFRYDRHPDHVALSRTVEDLARDRGSPFRLLEYFVYYQWKLLPAGDIRAYIRPAHLLRSDITAFRAGKRAALDCFVSQTTCFYPWQHKPVLSDALLTSFAQGPELFMTAGPGCADGEVFSIPPFLVRAVHAVEPRLKNGKEHTLAFLHALRRRWRAIGL
jgi:LmbE family N-acetylglucosaminyl deacetylase